MALKPPRRAHAATGVAAGGGGGFIGPWVDVTLLRALLTTYTNASQRVRFVNIVIGGANDLEITQQGVANRPTFITQGNGGSAVLIVPPGETYRARSAGGAGAISTWWETT